MSAQVFVGIRASHSTVSVQPNLDRLLQVVSHFHANRFCQCKRHLKQLKASTSDPVRNDYSFLTVGLVSAVWDVFYWLALSIILALIKGTLHGLLVVWTAITGFQKDAQAISVMLLAVCLKWISS